MQCVHADYGGVHTYTIEVCMCRILKPMHTKWNLMHQVFFVPNVFEVLEFGMLPRVCLIEGGWQEGRALSEEF
jgi:hypothetical protein